MNNIDMNQTNKGVGVRTMRKGVNQRCERGEQPTAKAAPSSTKPHSRHDATPSSHFTDCQFGVRQRETEKERDRLLTYEVLLLTQNILKKLK